jgi:anti-anti-sigma factor
MREARIATHRFHYNVSEDCAIVRPDGACDEKRTQALAKFVSSPLISANHLILDLSHAEYVETPGFRWLLRHVRDLESTGRTLTVVGLSPSVERAFRLLKLEKVIGIAKDVPEALERLHCAPQPAVV